MSSQLNTAKVRPAELAPKRHVVNLRLAYLSIARADSPLRQLIHCSPSPCSWGQQSEAWAKCSVKCGIFFNVIAFLPHFFLFSKMIMPCSTCLTPKGTGCLQLNKCFFIIIIRGPGLGVFIQLCESLGLTYIYQNELAESFQVTRRKTLSSFIHWAQMLDQGIHVIAKLLGTQSKGQAQEIKFSSEVSMNADF